jgi:hypothetical protein
LPNQIQTLANSETFWLVVGAIVVYFSNSIVSLGVVGRLPQTSPFFRALRKAHGFLNKIDPGGNVAPGFGLCFAFAAATMLSGCFGTLEETRGEIRVGAPTARSSGTCAALSSKERAWTAVTVTTGALSGASGVTMIPVKSHDATVALAAGVVVLSAATVGSLSMAQSYSRDWTREQCGQ